MSSFRKIRRRGWQTSFPALALAAPVLLPDQPVEGLADLFSLHTFDRVSATPGHCQEEPGDGDAEIIPDILHPVFSAPSYRGATPEPACKHRSSPALPPRECGAT